MLPTKKVLDKESIKKLESTLSADQEAALARLEKGEGDKSIRDLGEDLSRSLMINGNLLCINPTAREIYIYLLSKNYTEEDIKFLRENYTQGKPATISNAIIAELTCAAAAKNYSFSCRDLNIELKKDESGCFSFEFSSSLMLTDPSSEKRESLGIIKYGLRFESGKTLDLSTEFPAAGGDITVVKNMTLKNIDFKPRFNLNNNILCEIIYPFLSSLCQKFGIKPNEKWAYNVELYNLEKNVKNLTGKCRQEVTNANNKTELGKSPSDDALTGEGIETFIDCRISR